VIVDAWVVELGFWARIGALVVLVGGSLVYFAMVMLPLAWRRINPAFAARTIEQSEPSLKNSLINFLSFRARREGLHAVVYHALQQRAAADLSHTPVESAIDYSRLLRIGYVLAGLLLICGLYTVVSPKKPFATLQRVMSPLADVARPSVVQITRVKPGNSEVFHGDRVKVTASIRGLASDQPAVVRYSSVDGQIVDARLEMKADKTGTHFEVDLPPGEEGVRQDLRYRLEAGDARTPEYTLRMIPVPRISVRRLEYDYPDYTRRPNRIVEEEADVKAVEGTRVTVHARANQPIKSAYIELFPGTSGEAARPVPITMEHSGEEAWGSFVLKLRGRTPKYGSYQVRFRTAANHLSRVPTVHRIEVTPDLEPEVEILKPKSNRISIPEGGSQRIEIRALDPDYGLSRIVLTADIGGTRLLEEKLLDEPAGRTGQVNTTFDFDAKDLKLVAGNEVVYWAEVSDNRTNPDSGAVDPNKARTENYFIEIVKPRRDTPKPDEEKPKEGKPEQEKKGDDEEGSAESSKDGSTGSKSGSGESSTSEGASEETSGDGSSGESSEGSSTSKGGGSSGSSKGQPSEENQGDGSAGGSPSEGASSGDATSNSSGQGGEQAEAGGGEGNGSADGQNSSTGGQTDGAQGGSAGGEGADGGDSRTEPLHDGEIIERVLKHKQEQLRKKLGDGESAEGADGGASQDSAGGQNANKPAGSADDQNQGADSGGAGNEKSNEKSGDHNSGGNPSKDNSAGGDSSSRPNGAGDGGQQAQPGGTANQGQQPKPGDGQQGQPMGGGDQPQQPQGGGEKSGSQSGSPSGGGQKKDGQKKDGQQQGGGSQNGGAQNPSGGGKKDGQQQSGGGGTTSAQGQNRQKKDGGGSAGGSQPKDGGQSPSNSQNQSSGQGDQGGDKSGAGSKGGGQNSPQPGQGSAGSSTPSDTGSGAADQPGNGETTNKPGGSKPGDTGAGNRQGAGSASGGKQGDGEGQSGARQPGDEQPGQTPPEQPKDAGGEKPNSETSRREPSGGETSSDGSSTESTGSRSAGSTTSRGSAGGSSPSGGFGSKGAGDSPPAPPGEAPEADKAKLEYAKKATDLALEYLRDQKNKRDPKLLDELNMTEKELEEWVNHWEAMKRGAREGEVDRDSYTDALRSLGLRPHADRRRAVGARDDNLRGADSGVRSEPPPAFIEQFRAFKSGAARAEDQRSRGE
jgi:hypothetical protein